VCGKNHLSVMCVVCGERAVASYGGYHECVACDVLISTRPAGQYDENYYYAKRNASSPRSLERAALLWKLVGKDLLGRKCLDFGCNDGAFVRVANRMGADCWGVDINASMVKLADMVGGGKFLLPELVDEAFEVVTAFDVLEHFERPLEFFSAVDRFIMPNGRVIVSTPNTRSKWRAIYGPGWHGYGIPQYHRFLVSLSALRVIMSGAGYAIEYADTVAPIEGRKWRLLIASGYRLHSGSFSKAARLPRAIVKYLLGRRASGEEDTLIAIGRKRGHA
jgi:SAM-dependent methyltransferase